LVASSSVATEHDVRPGDGGFDAWRTALDELLQAYCDVHRRVLQLPSFSEAFRTAWRHRREFRREYRERVGSLGRAAQFFGVARGDFIWGASFPRSFVRYFADDHLGARLRLLRQCVLVADTLGQKQQDQLVAKIDRLLPLWPQRPFARFFYGYLLPLTVFVAPVVRFWTAGNTDPENAYATPLLLFLYAGIFVAFPAVAFSAKRAIMLGESGGRFNMAPGLQAGQGVYGVEKRVFGVLAPSRREYPLDLVLIPAAIILLASGFLPLLELPYVGSGYAVPVWFSVILVLIGAVATLASIAMSVLTFRARRRLGRC
jgi:hypothetical protein